MGDAGVLVALVTGGIGVLTSIIGGLLALVKEKNGLSISIEGKWGKVTIPANTPPDDIERYIGMARGPAERVRIAM
jgi:hypothetical protein